VQVFQESGLAINLDLHIQDVVELLESEGLDRVILVGHAYAGMVVTGVAEVCPQRLAHLIRLLLLIDVYGTFF